MMINGETSYDGHPAQPATIETKNTQKKTWKITTRFDGVSSFATLQFARLHTHPPPHPPTPTPPHPRLAPASAVFDFQNKQDGLKDPNGNKIEPALWWLTGRLLTTVTRHNQLQ